MLKSKKNVIKISLLAIVSISGCSLPPSNGAGGGEPVILGKDTRRVMIAEGNSRVAIVGGSAAATASVSGDLSVAQEDPTVLLFLMGTLSPPVVNGSVVQATEVRVSGTKAYVSYNIQGDQQRGAIDVIDIANPMAPALLSTIAFPDADVNSIELSNAHAPTIAPVAIYAVGARTRLAVADKGAFVQKINLDVGGLPTSLDARVDLPIGEAGVSVRLAPNAATLYVASGDNGGIYALQTSNLGAAAPLAAPMIAPRVRDLSVDGLDSSLWSLRAGPGIVASYLPPFTPSSVPVANYNLGGAATVHSKSTVSLARKTYGATVGEMGWQLRCRQNGNALGSFAPPVVSGQLGSDLVTNGIGQSGEFIFAANGAGGLGVFSSKLNQTTHPSGGCAPIGVNPLGRANLGAWSANGVFVSGNYVFVATGKGGLKILSIARSQGLSGNVYNLPSSTNSVPNFDLMTPATSLVSANINFPTITYPNTFPGLNATYKEYFGIKYESILRVPEGCNPCSFKVTSDDGSILYIDGDKVVDHDGLHSPSSKTGTIALTPGFYPMRLDYFQGPGNQMALMLEWKLQGDIGYSVVPAANFSRPGW